MNIVPFAISTVAALAALVAGVGYSGAHSDLNRVQAENNVKQKELLVLQQKFTDLEIEAQALSESLQLKQAEAQNQQREIEEGGQVAQKFGPPILRELGYIATKKNHDKIKNILTRHGVQGFIFTPEQVKQVDEALEKQKAQGGGAATSAPALPAAAAPR